MKTKLFDKRVKARDVILNRNFCISGNMFVKQCLDYISYITHSVDEKKINEIKQRHYDYSLVEITDDNVINQLVWEFGLYTSFISIKEGITKSLEYFKMFLQRLNDEFYSELTFIPKVNFNDDMKLIDMINEWAVQTNLTLSCVNERTNDGEYCDEYTFVLGLLLTSLKNVIEKIEASDYIPF